MLDRKKQLPDRWQQAALVQALPVRSERAQRDRTEQAPLEDSALEQVELLHRYCLARSGRGPEGPVQAAAVESAPALLPLPPSIARIRLSSKQRC